MIEPHNSQITRAIFLFKKPPIMHHLRWNYAKMISHSVNKNMFFVSLSGRWRRRHSNCETYFPKTLMMAHSREFYLFVVAKQLTNLIGYFQFYCSTWNFNSNKINFCQFPTVSPYLIIERVVKGSFTRPQLTANFFSDAASCINFFSWKEVF